MSNDSSRSSKVNDFGTNRKRVCDFLLVINSNLGPILPRFRCREFSADKSDSNPISPEFWGCSPWTRLQYCGSEERRLYANYSCNYFRTSPTYMPTVYLNVTGTTYDSNTALALRASRGKNPKPMSWSDKQ